MKYNLSINQKAWADLNLDLDPYDLIIFDFIFTFSTTGNGQTLHDAGFTWFWISYELIIQQVPILRRWVGNPKEGLPRYEPWKKNTVYTRMKKLIDSGLLMANPNNKTLGRSYFRMGPVAPNYFFSKGVGSQNIPMDTNPEVSGSGSAPPADVDQEDNSITNNRGDKEKGDFNFCEGFGIKIGKVDFPEGYPHPDTNPPLDWDLWWKLYDINQKRIPAETFMRAEIWQSVYRHTFLLVAVTEKAYRTPPDAYLRYGRYRDEIIDRRKKSSYSAPVEQGTLKFTMD